MGKVDRFLRYVQVSVASDVFENMLMSVWFDNLLERGRSLAFIYDAYVIVVGPIFEDRASEAPRPNLDRPPSERGSFLRLSSRFVTDSRPSY